MANSLILEPPESAALPLSTRRANLQDAKAIHLLIHSFTHDGTLLHRTYKEICENIHTFTVVKTAQVDSSAAPRSTSTARTSPKSAPSSSAPTQRITEQAASSSNRSSIKPRRPPSHASASSPASQPFFSTSNSASSNVKIYATKS